MYSNPEGFSSFRLCLLGAPLQTQYSTNAPHIASHAAKETSAVYYPGLECGPITKNLNVSASLDTIQYGGVAKLSCDRGLMYVNLEESEVVCGASSNSSCHTRTHMSQLN